MSFDLASVGVGVGDGVVAGARSTWSHAAGTEKGLAELATVAAGPNPIA